MHNTYHIKGNEQIVVLFLVWADVEKVKAIKLHLCVKKTEYRPLATWKKQ